MYMYAIWCSPFVRMSRGASVRLLSLKFSGLFYIVTVCSLFWGIISYFTATSGNYSELAWLQFIYLFTMIYINGKTSIFTWAFKITSVQFKSKYISDNNFLLLGIGWHRYPSKSTDTPPLCPSVSPAPQDKHCNLHVVNAVINYNTHFVL